MSLVYLYQELILCLYPNHTPYDHLKSIPFLKERSFFLHTTRKNTSSTYRGYNPLETKSTRIHLLPQFTQFSNYNDNVIVVCNEDEVSHGQRVVG